MKQSTAKIEAEFKLTTELSEKVQYSRNQAIKNSLQWLKQYCLCQ